MSVEDIVFELARRTGGSVGQSFTGIGDNAEGFAKYRTSKIIAWEEFKKKGVWVGPSYKYGKYAEVFHTPSRKFEFQSGSLKALLGTGQPITEATLLPHYEASRDSGGGTAYPLVLNPYQPVLAIENGSQNYGWAQESFLVMHGLGWTNLAEINRETAEGLGIHDGDIVWVESSTGKLKARARVVEGMHPNAVAMAIGQGHDAYGKWQKGIGVNPNQIIGADIDRLSGQSALFATKVRVYRA